MTSACATTTRCSRRRHWQATPAHTWSSACSSAAALEPRGLPDRDHQSRLSLYLHFGQLAAERAVLAVRASGAPSADVESFVDEAVT